MISTKQDLFTILDRRTEMINHLPPQDLDMFKTHPEKIFCSPGATREQISWFNRYVKNIHNYVFLILIEFASGKFGLHHFSNNSKIAVRFVEKQYIIESYSPDMILTIGKFENEEEFCKRFNEILQEYDESTL